MCVCVCVCVCAGLLLSYVRLCAYVCCAYVCTHVHVCTRVRVHMCGACVYTPVILLADFRRIFWFRS